MANLTDLPIQEALDPEIAKDIVRHAGSGRVIALKTQRNEYCAIHRLPEEILLHILLLVKLLVEELRIASYGSTRRDWFAITRVCSSWRNLVMNYPHFWTLIDTASPHVHRTLSHAKGAPIEVKLHELPESSSEEFWVLATHLMSRTSQMRDLDIHLTQHHTPELFALSPASRVPILETLEIWGSPYPRNGQVVHGCAIWSQMPSLRCMRISDALLPEEAIFAPCLTKFHIDSRSQVSMSWLLKTLRGSPLLEDVDVGFVGPKPMNFVTPLVNLPHLRRLSLDSDCASAVNIFDHLKVPVTSAIEVTLILGTADIESPADISGLQNDLSRFTHDEAHPPLERIFISLHNGEFRLYVYRSGDSYGYHDEQIAGGTPFLGFTIPRTFHLPIPSCVELCYALPLSTISTLALDGFRGNFLMQTALSMLNACKNIQTLEVSHCDPSLIGELSRTHGDGVPMNTGLKCLVLKHDMFYVDENSDELSNLLPLLFELLVARRAFGSPITALRCWRCRKIARRDMKELKRVVDSFEWDDTME